MLHESDTLVFHESDGIRYLDWAGLWGAGRVL